MHDGLARLDLLQGHGAGGERNEVEQIAQDDGPSLGVKRFAVLAEELGVVLTDGTMEQVDDLRGDDVLLAAERAPLGDARARELSRGGALLLSLRLVVALVALALDVSDAETAHATHGTGEVSVNESLVKAHDLENLGGVVTLDRGDAHLAHDGDDATRHSLVVVRDALLGGDADGPASGEVTDAVVGHVRVDSRGGVPDERRVVVRGDGVSALHDEVGAHTDAGMDEVVVHRAHREERRDGDLAVGGAVGEDHHVRPGAHGLLDARVKLLEGDLERVLAAVATVRHREALRPEALSVETGDAVELVLGEDGVLEADETAVGARVLEHVAVVADIEDRRGDEALAQGVDRRVRDLGEELVEVVEERPGATREHRERHVGAHGGQRGRPLLGHGADRLLHVVEVVSVACEADGELDRGVPVRERVSVRGSEVVHLKRPGVDPVTEGLLACEGVLDLVVPENPPLLRVDDEHLAGSERTSLKDVLGLERKGARLAREHETVVSRDVVARGAQTVAVEGGTGDAPV